jgi:hypothetical protein
MLAPKVTKPRIRAVVGSMRSRALQRASAARRPGSNLSETAFLLQRTIGNQATLRYLTSRHSNSMPTGEDPSRTSSHPLRAPSQSHGADAPRPAGVGGAPDIVDRVLRSPGRPLTRAERDFMEQRLGSDLGAVRLHTDDKAAAAAASVSAAAFTVGEHVVFAKDALAPQQPDGRRLLAHELAHTIQQRGAAPEVKAFGANDSRAELEARSAADAAVDGRPGRYVPTAPARCQGILQRQPAPPLARGFELTQNPGLPPFGKRFDEILAKPTISSTDADTALSMYANLDAAMRQAKLSTHYPTGKVTQLLGALTPAAAQRHRAELQDLLRKVEEEETLKSSGRSETQLSEIQGKWLQAKAPTPEAARAQVAALAVPPPAATTKWSAMTPAERAKWEADGNAAVATMVSYAAANYPELKLKAAEFRLAFEDVEKAGSTVMAFSESGGSGPRLVVGYTFVTTTNINPAYMIEVVVHELRGHPEFESMDKSYQFSLYQKSHPYQPSYKTPAAGSQEARNEILSYGYFETEIFSVMRGLPYAHTVSSADAAKGAHVLSAPKDVIAYHVKQIVDAWQPDVGAALLRGLYMRFLLDPRIASAALDAFRDAVKLHAAAKAAYILK